MCYNKSDTVCARRIYWAWLFLVFFVLSSFIDAEGAGGKLSLTVQDATGNLWRQKEIYVYKRGIDPADGKKKLIDNRGHYIEVGNIPSAYQTGGFWRWYDYPIAKAKTNDKGNVSIDLGAGLYAVYIPLGEEGRFGTAVWDISVADARETAVTVKTGMLSLVVQDAVSQILKNHDVYVYQQGIEAFEGEKAPPEPVEGKKVLVDNREHQIEVGNIPPAYQTGGFWRWYDYPIAKAKTDDKGNVSIDLGAGLYAMYIPLGEDGRFGFAIWDLTVKEDQTTPPPPPVLLSTLVKIEPNSQDVNKGKQFTVSVTVEGAKGLAGFQMGFKYNPAVLEVVDVKEGDFLKGGGGGTNWLPPTIDNKTGVVSGITGVRTSPGGIDGMGIIATLTLKAIAKGESPITLQGVLLSDLAAKKIPSVTQDAQVKVISPSFPAWDVNQDGVVNIFD
ncbi:hypothetical protein HYR99_19970, partial [Candidatus Poribacteria bacterium]|nr:hypothetical protein [Candidatus Poribacteria bacterium]